MIHINGHSVLDLTHMELCSMINGVSTNKSERDDIEVQRKWTKLVCFFLESIEGTYRLELEMQQHRQKRSNLIGS